MFEGSTLRLKHFLMFYTNAKTCLHVLRALTHTAHGHYEEDITLYKEFMRPILSYIGTAWASDIATTHLNRLVMYR